MITDPDTMPKRLGFIAQEVLPLFPYLVSDGGDYLGISYTNFGVLSVEAIQELRAEKDAEIEILNQKVAYLEKQNQELKAQNDQLFKSMEKMQAQIEIINQNLSITSYK